MASASAARSKRSPARQASTPARVSDAPFPYYGGKWYMAPYIASLLPPHDTYIEPYGGSGAVLFAKRPSKLEVYNDLDRGLVNFFRVLREPVQLQRLQALLELTPYARAEYVDCRTTWRDLLDAGDSVELARRWYVAVVASFSKHPTDAHGWSHTLSSNAHKVKSFRNAIDGLSICAQRFRMVQVEGADAVDVIRRYDRKSALFYLDPPYVWDTRKKNHKGNGYAHEMSDADHTRLLEALASLKGMAVLSGYRSPLYDDALASWRRIDYETWNWSDNARSSKSGAKSGAQREARTECLWLSPSISALQPSLFAGLEGGEL